MSMWSWGRYVCLIDIECYNWYSYNVYVNVYLFVEIGWGKYLLK